MAALEVLIPVSSFTSEDRVSTGEDRLPILDGIRGIAIALVLLGHLIVSAGPGLPLYFGTLTGEAGVAIFFALSGFLVTRVMLLDEIRVGHLRIGRFYERRALRIFPAFYVFLGASAIFAAAHVLERADQRTWVASIFYFRNLAGSGWNTGHLWSLSLEEQFYAVWPLLFLLLGTKNRRLLFIAAAVFVGIVVRCLWLGHLPSPLPLGTIAAVHRWPQMRLETFLIGAAFAIGDWTWPRKLRPVAILPFLALWHFGAILSRWTLAFDSSVTAFAVGTLMLWAILNPKCPTAHNLSGPVATYMGKVSYSIYLWQQLFLGPHLHWWSLGAIFACALLSYSLVERPALAWKEKFERRRAEQPRLTSYVAVSTPNPAALMRD
jgi:peptidoglycan/LPS O-acetylase OafA/YrhL